VINNGHMEAKNSLIWTVVGLVFGGPEARLKGSSDDVILLSQP